MTLLQKILAFIYGFNPIKLYIKNIDITNIKLYKTSNDKIHEHIMNNITRYSNYLD